MTLIPNVELRTELCEDARNLISDWKYCFNIVCLSFSSQTNLTLRAPSHDDTWIVNHVVLEVLNAYNVSVKFLQMVHWYVLFLVYFLCIKADRH
jgi:hypothetical protein